MSAAISSAIAPRRPAASCAGPFEGGRPAPRVVAGAAPFDGLVDAGGPRVGPFADDVVGPLRGGRTDDVAHAGADRAEGFVSNAPTTATRFSSEPMPPIVTRTTSPSARVNGASGTRPVPVSSMAPAGNDRARPRYAASCSKLRFIFAVL